MENILKRLFDYQRFEGNAALQQIIHSVHARYTARRQLEPDELEYIAAAGIPGIEHTKKKPTLG